MNKNTLPYIFGIIGIIGTAFTIYSIYKPDETKDLSITKLSDVNVFNINSEIPELKFIYKDKDLSETNEVLRITTLKIKNTGQREIIKADFDDKSKFGIEFKNSIIVDNPQIIETSKSYLKHISLDVDATNPSKLIISNFILDSEDFFAVKVLTKHQKETTPMLIPEGKIAGISNLLIKTEETTNNRNESLSNNDFMFMILMFVGLAIITNLLYSRLVKKVYPSFDRLYGSHLIPEDWEKEYSAKKKEKGLKIRDFFAKESELSKEMKDVIEYVFKSTDDNHLQNLITFLTNTSKLNKYYFEHIQPKSDIKKKMKSEFKDFEASIYSSTYEDELNRAIKYKFINIDKDNVVVEKIFIETLKKFETFLRYSNTAANKVYKK